MKRLLVLLVVLLVALIAADRILDRYGEQELAAEIQRSEGLREQPDVSIAGFPLITQALRGRYERIDVRVTGLAPQSGVHIQWLDVALRGVHIPPGQLMQRRVNRAPVDRATAVGHVTFAELNTVAVAQLPSDQFAVRFAPAGADRIAVTGEFRSEVATARIDGQAQLGVRDGGLSIRVLPESLTAVPEVLRERVATALSVGLPLPPLPFGFRVTGVAVNSSGVTVTAEAQDVVLSPNA